MKLTIHKISLRALTQYFIILLALFNGTAMWKYLADGPVVSGGVSYSFLGVIAAAAAGIYALTVFWMQKAGLTRTCLYAILSLLGCNAAYILLSQYAVNTFILEFILPLAAFTVFAFVLRQTGELNRFFLRFSNVVVLLAVISLIAYIGGGLLQILPAQNVTIYRDGRFYAVQSFFSLTYIGQTTQFLGTEMLRNTGIFLEAPGWVYPLVLAVFAELFCRERISRLRLSVLLLTVVTTFSSKGFILVPMLVGFKIFGNLERRSGLVQVLKKPALPLAALGFIVFVYYALVQKSIDGAHSFYVRIEDFLAALRVFGDHMLLGCGYGNLLPFEHYLTLQSASSITAGLIKVFAQCGLFVGIEYLLFAFLIWTRSSKEKRYVSGCFVVLFLLFMLTSSTWSGTVSVFILALGGSHLCRRKPAAERIEGRLGYGKAACQRDCSGVSGGSLSR